MSRSAYLKLVWLAGSVLGLTACGGGGGGGDGGGQPTTYTVGGAVSGANDIVVLRLNNGNNLSTTPGPFTFVTPLQSGASYTVTIVSTPATQNCSVTTGATGTIASANVVNVQITCTDKTYTIGGTVSGLTGTVVLRNNGVNELSVTANGTFTFTNPISHGVGYNVAVTTQPAGQVCTVTNGSSVATADVTNVAVTCVNNTSNARTVGGTVSGLTGTVVLQNNGANNLSLSANGQFAFGATVANGAAYNVTVLTQPAGQSCTVANGAGNAAADVTNVAVTCTTNQAGARTIGGTVSGLTGTVVLRNNGANDLTLSANGSFAFGNTVANGGAYDVTVLTQPVGQTCAVTNGSGTANANVTNVAVTCTTTTSNARTIGGAVSGLSGTLVLRNNGGNDLTLTANGAFTFGNTVANGAAYNVTVFSQPAAQSCVVTNGSGTANANVTNVTVTCTTKTYTIGGTASGLTGTVVLRNNGGNDLSVSANGTFTFGAPINHGASYNVTVLTQPAGQSCTVTNATGTAAANVTNVAVSCSSSARTIGGTVSGLTGTVVLRNNGGNDLSVSANGSFTFGATVANGAAYNVTVFAEPAGQTCTVANGSGTANANVTNVAVSCTTKTYTIGGTVTNLTGTVVLQNNGGNNLSVSANGSFTFTTPVAHGAAYAVTVLTQPSGQTCTVANGSGTATANVTNVAVNCVYPDLAANGKSLQVTTASSVAEFLGADLVGLSNRLTGEIYLKNPSAGNLVTVNPLQGTGQVLQTGSWTVAPDAGSGLLVATITANDSVRTFTMKVSIDAASGEIVVKTGAVITGQGLRDASWSIAGLDFTGGRLIVPAYSGEVFDAAHPPMNSFLQYPGSWNAQMLVYEAAAGSFVAYSTDQQYRFKQLRATTRGKSTVDLALFTEAVAPFTTASAVPEIEWRLKSFAGDWRIAAQAFKTWLNANRTPVARPSLGWVNDIRAVVTMHPLDVAMLPTLAAQLDPAKTLVYVADWRASNYDVNYPDYTPRASPSALTFVQTAHSLGFKVMLHFNLIGISPNHATYNTHIANQVKNADTHALEGWLWDCQQCPERIAFINPASSAFRTLQIQSMTPAITALQPDAIHLDVSGALYNDANGPIEGRTFAQGSARLHEDLIAAFPNVALGGESETDVLYPYQQFAQSSFWDEDANHGHPILNFLFDSHVQFYGHLGQPAATDGAFKTWLSNTERRSMLPTLGIYSASDLDMSLADNVRLMSLLKSWQDNAFEPDWVAPWLGDLVRYTGTAGKTAALSDNGTVETLVAAGTTLYELGHGSTRLDSTSYIPNWPAFDNASLYGLDAARKYWLDMVARPTTTHATSLPAGIRLGPDTFVTPRFGLFEVAGSGSSSAFDFENLFGAITGVRYQGVEYPLGFGAIAGTTTITIGGQARRAIYLQPPWQGQFGGETFAEYSMPLLAGAQLRFSVGVPNDQTCNDDGVTFRVTVNDLELYSQNWPKGNTWHDGAVDLSAYAGQTVRLRLTSHPGTLGSPACDWNGWSQVALVYPAVAPAPIAVPLVLDSTGTFAGFVGDGSSSFIPGSVLNLPVPGRFVVFTQPGAAIGNGTNLLTLNPAPQPWSGLRGEMVSQGGVFGAGTIGFGSSGGVSKNPSLHSHPPNNGRVVFSWTLGVPPGASLKLGWSAALDNGASADGVDFSVLINGVPYWRTTRTSAGWISSAVELQQWQGQNILLQLVADSRANYNSDASYWSDLITTTSATTCTYGVPGTPATVAAAGAQQNLSVTATVACPWVAASSVPWITFGANSSGTGNGTVNYVVAQNLGPPRSGTITVGGQTFTVNQN